MTKPTRLLFILNQTSRKGKVALNLLERALKNMNYSFSFHFTEAPKHAKELAQSLGQTLEKDDRLIVVGGDGTLNEVVSGLQEANLDVPVGYIPSGSGNDFARSHGISMGIEKALKRIIQAFPPTELDILKVEQGESIRYAINSTGAGIDGMVVNHVESKKTKEQIGSFSYFASIYRAAKQQEVFGVSIEIDEEIYQFDEALLVLGVNHKYIGGGINVHPKASPEDGLINVVVVEKVSFTELIHILTKIITGARHLKHNKVHHFTASKPVIRLSKEQFGQQDGEKINLSTEPWFFDITKQLFWL